MAEQPQFTKETRYDEGLAAALQFVADERETLLAPEEIGEVALIHARPIHITDIEKYRAEPFRKRGLFRFDRASSFAFYVKMHGITDHILATDTQFVAFLNGHTAENPGWHDHVASFALKPTPAWTAWMQQDSNWLNQQSFAEFLEDRLNEIAEPDGATLLEIATTLRVKNNINFQSKIQLANGSVRMAYEEDIEGKAGEHGDINIPEKLILVLQPYEGTNEQQIDARFRWRIDRGSVRFRFSLGEAVERIRDQAMEDARVEIEGISGKTVLYGAKA